jgi:hypothetical protein
LCELHPPSCQARGCQYRALGQAPSSAPEGTGRARLRLCAAHWQERDDDFDRLFGLALGGAAVELE